VTLFLLGAGAIVSMLAIVAYCVCVCRWLTKETE
jgi:hypothetical protein